MKIIIKKSVVAMLALSLFLTISSVSASADGLEDLGKEVDGSILTNEESAEAIWQNVARGSILNQGIVKITNISYNVKVKGGYYYRVRVGCVAQKGSTYESQVPVTNGIWIQ